MTLFELFPVPLSQSAAAVASVTSGSAAFLLGVAYFAAEPRSPATRWFALAVSASGISTALTVPLAFVYESGAPMSWFLRFPIFELLIYTGQSAWLLQVARTAQLGIPAWTWIRVCVAVTWASALIYFIAAALYPADRMTGFYCLLRGMDCVTVAFVWTFLLPLGVAVAGFNIGLVTLAILPIDRAERVRVTFVLMAGLFAYSSYYLPLGYGSMLGVVGFVITAMGFIRYHGIQGQRGTLLSRFLSPELSKLVRDKGIEHAVQPQSVEITVVCCDLRGFTRLSQLLASDQVIRLLNEYYEAIGKATGEFGGTIKDYAGDGVLILVGAPLPVPDHAQKGIALARRLHEVGRTFISHWAGPEMKLGMGVGIASGRVTVGAVGSSSRMEYTAVGPAVNLASRLCAQATDGEILVDDRTVELAGRHGLESRGKLPVKGIGEVRHFALST